MPSRGGLKTQQVQRVFTTEGDFHDDISKGAMVLITIRVPDYAITALPGVTSICFASDGFDLPPNFHSSSLQSR